MTSYQWQSDSSLFWNLRIEGGVVGVMRQQPAKRVQRWVRPFISRERRCRYSTRHDASSLPLVFLWSTVIDDAQRKRLLVWNLRLYSFDEVPVVAAIETNLRHRTCEVLPIGIIAMRPAIW
eukprot:4255458-Amphidinium_carterae.3